MNRQNGGRQTAWSGGGNSGSCSQYPPNIKLHSSPPTQLLNAFSGFSVGSCINEQLAKVKKLFSELKLVSDNLPVQSLVPMWGQPGNEATCTPSGKHDFCYKGI